MRLCSHRCGGTGTAVEQRAGSGARPPDVEASGSDGQALPSEGRRKAAETLKDIALQTSAPNFMGAFEGEVPEGRL